MLLLRRARPLRQLCRRASTTPQPIHDALRQVLENGTKKRRKFDESVDLDVTLNVDPRKPLQAVRGRSCSRFCSSQTARLPPALSPMITIFSLGIFACCTRYS